MWFCGDVIVVEVGNIPGTKSFPIPTRIFGRKYVMKRNRAVIQGLVYNIKVKLCTEIEWHYL